MRLLICLVLIPALLMAEPWGKDADLAQPKMLSCPPPEAASPMAFAAKVVIRFHQVVISPTDGPRSHYNPSSSYYGLDAISKYGFLRGYFMTCDRLMRENADPWVYRQCCLPDGTVLKWDQVP